MQDVCMYVWVCVCTYIYTYTYTHTYETINRANPKLIIIQEETQVKGTKNCFQRNHR